MPLVNEIILVQLAHMVPVVLRRFVLHRVLLLLRKLGLEMTFNSVATEWVSRLR